MLRGLGLPEFDDRFCLTTDYLDSVGHKVPVPQAKVTN